MSVVGINAVIGYVTESKSEKTINSLKSLVRPTALVRRDGETVQVGVEEVVPGDQLVLRPGSYVGADARLLSARNLSVDESALTGESMPVQKDDRRAHDLRFAPRRQDQHGLHGHPCDRRAGRSGGCSHRSLYRDRTDTDPRRRGKAPCDTHGTPARPHGH